MVANGVMTRDSMNIQPVNKQAGRKGTIPIPKTLNHATGIESTWKTGFNDKSWGSVSRGFASRASKLSKQKMDKIIEGAQAYVTDRTSRAVPRRESASGSIREHDEREYLVDDSSSSSDSDDEECKLSTLSSSFPLS
jgi:hypothetical protein